MIDELVATLDASPDDPASKLVDDQSGADQRPDPQPQVTERDLGRGKRMGKGVFERLCRRDVGGDAVARFAGFHRQRPRRVRRQHTAYHESEPRFRVGGHVLRDAMVAEPCAACERAPGGRHTVGGQHPPAQCAGAIERCGRHPTLRGRDPRLCRCGLLHRGGLGLRIGPHGFG